MNILVSHCLLGEPCRYDGKSKPVFELEKLRDKGHTLIPICPEVLGGLHTPRPPAERREDGRVVNRKGRDVTEEYCLGAQTALELARENECTLAILKAKSPSCGNYLIYDGSFTGTLKRGKGVTAELLEQAGIRVLNEEELDLLLNG